MMSLAGKDILAKRGDSLRALSEAADRTLGPIHPRTRCSRHVALVLGMQPGGAWKARKRLNSIGGTEAAKPVWIDLVTPTIVVAERVRALSVVYTARLMRRGGS
jgi:hypothetical protein